MKPSRQDEGYALLAAIAAIAVFSTLALALLSQVQGAILQANAQVERARADAAASAGVQLALQRVIATDPAFRWSLDGRPRDLTFAGSRLVIKVVDERTKLPLAALEEEQLPRLFELLGVPADRLAVVTDSFLDWTDDDDDPRPNGAESVYYARRGLHPPNTAIQSLDELALIRGFDPALVAKLKTVATVHFGTGPFDAAHASPIAIAVMSSGGEDSPEAIEAEREAEGQRPAIELGEEDMSGRTIEILVDATTPGGGRSHVRQAVELTGNNDRPYAIIEVD